MAAEKKNNGINFSYAAFIGSAVFLLLLTLFSLLRFERQKEASGWVAHTYLAKLKIEETYSLLRDAESNQRGFLLTKDSSYIKNFTLSKHNLDTNLFQLGSLVMDNSKQLENVKSLERLAQSRFSRLYVVLDSAKFLVDSLPVAYIIPGKLIMDTIQNHIKNMEAMEDSLLVKRDYDKQKQDRNVTLFIILFSVISLSVLFFSFFKLRDENIKRVKAELDVGLLEAAVNERTTEIRKINQALANKNIELERKNADLTSFTFMASHDLKEPLRKIETFSNRITETEAQHLTEKSKSYFEKITGAAKRMQTLIDSVLMYAQTDDDRSDFKKVDLNKTAAAAIEILRESIKEKGAVIEYSGLPEVKAMPQQMEQLFTNLIGNAIKYSKTGLLPVIKINAQKFKADENPQKGDTWKIDFSDNGIGFEEKYKEKIFQIFQRLHGRDEYSGTGIGLAICKKIVENHNGSITASSVPGEGSVFSIILPQNAVQKNQ